MAKKEAQRPFGREEVRAALIASANELFGKKGPDAVSVRDVAQNAKVNHALVHRHFGSKGQLLQEVMQEHADSFIAQMERAQTIPDAYDALFEVMASNPAFVLTVAQLLLSGHALEDFVPRTRGMLTLTALLAEKRELPNEEAQLVAASTTAFLMGWLLFEPFVIFASGYKGDIEAARCRVASLIEQIATEM